MHPYAWLSLEVAQLTDSLEEISEIDPLELAELFGNIGGFWGELDTTEDGSKLTRIDGGREGGKGGVQEGIVSEKGDSAGRRLEVLFFGLELPPEEVHSLIYGDECGIFCYR